MCGISGFSWSDPALIRSMAAILGHRGPDHRGFHIEKGISLASNRLKIIDRSQRGNQPIYNETGTICTVYNGEIYNFKVLREKLERKGHRFSSQSDTEVIVHAYEEFGEGCFEKFDGMFAIAVWDSKKKKLLLARDHHGIKPLYYTFIGKDIIFASEIKALLVHDFLRSVNKRALQCYLAFRSNSLNETLFKGVFKLAPGCCLSFQNKRPAARRFYLEPKVNCSDLPPISTISKKILSELKKSVAQSLVSEVPLGIYLSGGLDSTAILALAHENSRDPMQTFSAGFEQVEHNELEFARYVCDYYGTDHHEIMIPNDSWKMLPSIIWHLDEPIADATCIPVYMLSREMKRHATVVLTGDGGDELFGGYSQFRFMGWHRYASRFPAAIKNAVVRLARSNPDLMNYLFRYSKDLGEGGISRLNTFLNQSKPSDAYCTLMQVFDRQERQSLLNTIGSLNEIPNHVRRLYVQGPGKMLDKILFVDRHLVLADQLMMKTDKCTMAHSIEARVPFLNGRISDLALSLPSHLKIKGPTDKYILRKSLSQVVPKKILKRKKQTFFVPIHHWFRGELKDASMALLNRKKLKRQGIIDPGYVEKLWLKYPRSPLYHARQLYGLVAFQLWHDTFIEEDKSSQKAFA